MPTNSLFQSHPDWLLPNRIHKLSSRLLYLGNPAALAWQYDRPGAGRGVVQAFRRAKSSEAARRLTLAGLDPAARYRFTDLDRPAVLTYEKLPPSGG